VITRRQANDLIAANYSPALSWDDPEWWEDMAEALMEFRSVKDLRHGPNAWEPRWTVPPQWPGATKS
jgi:hypothetical protein